MNRHHRAVCLTENPELFFLVDSTGPTLQQIEDARRICRSYAVKGQYLNWTLDTGQDHGTWDGMGENEHQVIERRAARSRVRVG